MENESGNVENETKNVDRDALIMDALTTIATQLDALTQNQTAMSTVLLEIREKVGLSG
jgi:hypothetical protein